MANPANLAVALELARAGIPVFPARVMRRFKGRWVKQPAVTGWRVLATTDEVQIGTWWRQFPQALPGIELEQAKLVVIDPDQHGNGPDGTEAFAQLCADIGGLPEHPITQTPSGHHHIFAQNGHMLGNDTGGLPPGVDVRGAGGWIVAPGAVRSDGAAYAPRQGAPPLAEAYRTGTIPPLPKSLADIIRDEPRHKDPGRSNNRTARAPEGGRLDAGAALAGMKPIGASVNEIQPRVILSLLQTGMHPDDVIERVVGATMEMAANNGLNWSRAVEVKCVTARCQSGVRKLNQEYDPSTRTIPPWLAGTFHARWAETLSTGKRPWLGRNTRDRVWSVWEKHGAMAEQPTGTSQGADTKSKGGQQEPGQTSGGEHKYRFKLLPFADVRPGPEPLYLVDELIPAAGLVDLWGPPKTFKSFFMLDLVFHVAMGWEYRDRYVHQGAVVYCAFEGAHGYKKRAEALRLHYEIAADAQVPLYFMPGQANLITEHVLLIAEIRAQLGDVRPVAVVLDTLNKSLVGSESKDIDMAAYVRAAEAIRDAFQCVVIIVHHCGWDETRPRGHSSLPAAVDAQLAVTRDGDMLVVTVEMMRDGPEDTQVVSKVKSIEVGKDDNGKILTSLVVTPSSDTPLAGPRSWPKSLVVFRRAMRAALRAHGELFHENVLAPPVRAVTVEEVRAEFYAVSPAGGDSDDQRQASKQKAFRRCLEKAQVADLIRIRQRPNGPEMVWFSVADTTDEPGRG